MELIIFFNPPGLKEAHIFLFQ